MDEECIRRLELGGPTVASNHCSKAKYPSGTFLSDIFTQWLD